ncbi:MAG: hypothetical protein E7Z98_06835 [Olsenella sp.]|nr:hypothetical protein [Olsenella sp.]
MSLYWPNEHVAIEIVDDPMAPPFDRSVDPEATVLQVTCAQLCDPDANQAFMRTVCEAMGRRFPGDHIPGWTEANKALIRELTMGIDELPEYRDLI